ncbi:MAG: hypothetical protein AB8F78_05115 [Saprospiraceae bacterium]
MSFNAIGKALEVELQPLIGASLNSVYNFEVIEDDTVLTPFVTIAPDTSDEQLLDTASNEQTIVFIISVVDQATQDRIDVEDNIRTLVDAVALKIKLMDTITYNN